MHIYTVGIWCNCDKPAAVDMAGRLVSALKKRGVRASGSETLIGNLGGAECGVEEGFSECDVIAALGGDGTYLSCMEVALPRDVPIWGVNLGRLGFLSESEPAQLERDTELLLDGRYAIEERMLIKAEFADGRVYRALNEAAVIRASTATRILTLEITRAGALVDRFAGDGAIVATPTGSTAYSFSAGGPVLTPDLRLMVLTPICPHTPHTRPMVLSPDIPIEVRAEGARDAVLSIDGRHVGALMDGERVKIVAARERLRFIRLRDMDFFTLLRGKLLGWATTSGEEAT